MVLLVLVVLASICWSASYSQLTVDMKLPSRENYMESYETSLTHYRKQDYLNTKVYTELALADKRYRDVMLIKCHDRCSDKSGKDSKQLFFLSLVTEEKCTRKCMKRLFGKPLQLPLWVIKDFKSRQPYSYLQYAYYKTGDLTAAFEAALINLKYNKNSEMMQQNVAFYGSRIRDMSDILRHEQPDSIDTFHMGTESYGKEDYTAATSQFNVSLKLYVEEVGKCKILCATGYDEYDGKKAPDLNDTNTFQDQFVKMYHKVMECRYNCMGKYDKIVEDIREDYLPQLLNYLQFSAFQTNDVKFAGQVAAAYLLLKPGDQTMITNMNYYTTQLAGTQEPLSFLHNLISENNLDMEVLSAIVGKKEMRKRLKDKQNYVLGDMGLISELNPDKYILWRNTY